MKIIVLGSGYVGLVTGVCFADKGHKVYSLDIDAEKVKKINSGKSPIFEPGLEELLKKNLENGNFKAFLSDDFYSQNISTDISFICVPTPSREDGSMDLKFIEKAAEDLTKYVKNIKQYHVVTVKSTVVPSTSDKTVLSILKKSGKKIGEDFGLCMNPEFLREGSAVGDFLHPDKIVLGSYDDRSANILEKVYESWSKNIPRIKANLRTAEMIKYAQNSFLATKISFINEIANMCRKMGIDAKQVSYAVGLDNRINPQFLNFGVGFGGSCFPKDVKALIAASEKNGFEPKLLKSVIHVNEKQPLEALKMAENIEGKTVSILGLAFKPNTDDIREAPSIKLIQELKKHNVTIQAYDPQATENMKTLFPDINYTESPLDALKNSDICFVMTEWEEIKNLKPEDFLNSMRNPVIIDGRRAFNPEAKKKAGIDYKAIGYGTYEED